MSNCSSAVLTAIRCFQLADILLQDLKMPDQWDVLTSTGKLRRFINKADARIEAPGCGAFRAAARFGRAPRFWQVLLEDSADYSGLNSQYPIFFPLESHLGSLRQVSILPYWWQDPGDELKPWVLNFQPEAWVRIYPPGIGVVTVQATLSFKPGLPLPALASLCRTDQWIVKKDDESDSSYDEMCEHVVAHMCESLLPDSKVTPLQRLHDTIPPYFVIEIDCPQGEFAKDLKGLSRLIAAEQQGDSLGKIQANLKSRMSNPKASGCTSAGDLVFPGQRICLLHLEPAQGQDQATKGQKGLLKECGWLAEVLVAAASQFRYYAQRQPDLLLSLSQAAAATGLNKQPDLAVVCAEVSRHANCAYQTMRAFAHAWDRVGRLDQPILTALSDELWARVGQAQQQSLASGVKQLAAGAKDLSSASSGILGVLDKLKPILDLIPKGKK